MGRSLCGVVLACVVWLAAGCGPTTFVVGIAPGDQALAETVIDKPAKRTRDRVAVIDVTGMILNAKTPGILRDGENPVSRFRESLDKAAADEDVKAVVLRMNTPGGAVTASDAMYRDVLSFKEETGKPVVVMMMDVAASGGYYLACAGDHIVAYPSTVTASIGVIIQTVSLQPALASIGIQTQAITSGPNKDAGSPLSAMTDGHRAVLQQMVDTFYADFTRTVRDARPSISEEDFKQVTDGRIVSGQHAYEVGLVDQLGDLDDAFAKAKALAGIEHAALVRYHRPLEYVGSPYASANHAAGNPPAAGSTQINLLQLNLDGSLGTLTTPGFYYVWLPGVR
ncbi:MAG: signal peptide peptidase SppA [Phycisphaeraceae bacterium]